MPTNTGNTQNLNLVPNEPDLIDLMHLLKKDILLDLNSHHIGTIQSFSSANQTASVTINYKKTYFEFDGTSNNYAPVLVNYPILVDCPVICLGGGQGSLTFPITAGDECLVLFNDRDLDNWFTGSSSSGNATARLHAFADGIVLVGLRSLSHVLQNYDATRAVFSAGSAAVAVNPSSSKVLITNSYPSNSTTLNSTLQSLLSDLQNLISAITTNASSFIPVTGAPGSPSPLSPAVVTALTMVSVSLTTLSTEIGGLLE